MNRRMKRVLGALSLGVFSISTLFGQTIQDGLAELNADRDNKAKEIFTKLAESTPSPQTLYYLGYFNVRTGDLNAAKAAFEKGAALDEKDYLNRVGLASVALGTGDRAKAKELIDLAEKKKGKDPEVLLRAAEAYVLFREGANDPAEAIRLADLALKRDKNLADAHIVKGDAFRIKVEGGPAVTSYEYALSAKPNYPLAYNRIGQVYLASRNYELARENYNKAIAADPNYAAAYKDLADLYFSARQYKNAADNFDKYMSISGTTDPEVTLRAAQYAFTNDDFAKSLQFLESVKGKISNPIILRMYGWSYFKTNELDKSIASLKEFIKVGPAAGKTLVPDDYKYLGRAINKLSENGKYNDEGISYLSKAAEMDTSKVDAAVTYKEIGAVYVEDKKYDQAIPYYSKGIQLDTTAKSLTNDLYALGVAYYQKAFPMAPQPGSADSAAVAEQRKATFLQSDSVFAVLTKKIPNWPPSYYFRGMSLNYVHGLMANLENGYSEPYYEKLIQLSKEQEVSVGMRRVALGYLGAYHQLKDPAKAKPYWEDLLKIDPDNAQAKAALGLTPAVAPAATPVAPVKKGK